MSATPGWLRLSGGIPPEPDTSDWDAVCAGPHVERFLAALLRELAGVEWGAAQITREVEDDEWRLQEAWHGSETCMFEVRVHTCRATSDIPVACVWRTRGVPGMELLWEYGLEKAGQLGHCAYRHGRLKCRFEDAAAQMAFENAWRQVIGTQPHWSAEPLPDAIPE